MLWVFDDIAFSGFSFNVILVFEVMNGFKKEVGVLVIYLRGVNLNKFLLNSGSVYPRAIYMPDVTCISLN